MFFFRRIETYWSRFLFDWEIFWDGVLFQRTWKQFHTGGNSFPLWSSPQMLHLRGGVFHTSGSPGQRDLVLTSRIISSHQFKELLPVLIALLREQSLRDMFLQVLTDMPETSRHSQESLSSTHFSRDFPTCRAKESPHREHVCGRNIMCG